jgi:hypothetical protein
MRALKKKCRRFSIGSMALRDILDLVERGVLAKDQGGGRSTSYSLAAADAPSN